MIPLKKKTTSFSPAIFATVLVGFFLAGLVLPMGKAQALTMYVKKSRTKMTAKESARSKVVKVLGKGTAVKVLKKSKKFFKVSAGGKSGWVFKFRLSAKAPAGSAQDDDFLNALGGDQKMAARESASGSSIRGLSPVSEKRARSKGIAVENIEAVKQMESFKVSDQEVDRFLEKGGLGEYGQ
ncbi:hypothetical protein UR09_02120 [Candidatus Nitromaritima sp. SCGC AAA799-A02]|nr:hypothetical protein UZ36_04650 [Candidatus Nitromaritima sp. SCGC AAA799-C22]KMP11990.1 hypothetical protein UR09_02120 [Candidatus Nitromaritima sp. SCGC AAA799-A02]